MIMLVTLWWCSQRWQWWQTGLQGVSQGHAKSQRLTCVWFCVWCEAIDLSDTHRPLIDGMIQCKCFSITGMQKPNIFWKVGWGTWLGEPVHHGWSQAKSKSRSKFLHSALWLEKELFGTFVIDFYIKFDVNSDTSSTRLSKSGAWWSLGGFQSHGQIKAAIVGKLEVVATLWNPAPSQCQGGEIQIKYKWLWEIQNLKILNLKITCLPVFQTSSIIHCSHEFFSKNVPGRLFWSQQGPIFKIRI